MGAPDIASISDAEFKGALLAELRAIRRALEAQNVATVAPTAKVRAGRRRALIRQLADGLGLGLTWMAAQQIAMILKGAKDAPHGASTAVTALRQDKDCPRSDRQIYRIITEEKSTDTTDGLAVLCQWGTKR